MSEQHEFQCGQLRLLIAATGEPSEKSSSQDFDGIPVPAVDRNWFNVAFFFPDGTKAHHRINSGSAMPADSFNAAWIAAMGSVGAFVGTHKMLNGGAAVLDPESARVVSFLEIDDAGEAVIKYEGKTVMELMAEAEAECSSPH